MLLFADGDGFWTMKTVIDLIAVVGLFLESLRDREWARTQIRLDDAEQYLTRLLVNPRLDEGERRFLFRASDDLRILSQTVQACRTASQPKNVSKSKQQQLDGIIRGIALIGSRLRGRVVGESDVPETGRAVEPPAEADPGQPR